MKAFWARLSERERLFVAVGGAVVAVFIVLQLMISPALGWRAGQSDRRNRAEELYRLVAEASATAGTVAARGDADLQTPILNVLTQSTGEFGVEVNYRNGRQDGGVEANVAADPAKLFEWLVMLEDRYGVAVASADVSRDASGAKVQAQ